MQTFGGRLKLVAALFGLRTSAELARHFNRWAVRRGKNIKISRQTAGVWMNAGEHHMPSQHLILLCDSLHCSVRFLSEGRGPELIIHSDLRDELLTAVANVPPEEYPALIEYCKRLTKV